MTKLFHYTGCGLDYVYLENGFTVKDTPHGKAVSIHDAHGLHEAIAIAVISHPGRLKGKEVRFLRGQIDISQAGLAKVLGTTRAAIARWEAEPEKVIPGPAERALRLFYALKVGGSEVANRVVELLYEIDELEHRADVFKETEAGWRREAA